MRKRRVGIIELMRNARKKKLIPFLTRANSIGIMPQAVAVWCEKAGHEVTLVSYTGFENLLKELPADVDIVFIGAFTRSAQLAYALSHLFRSRGIVTVLGGPHARCYPEDAQRYFDYVLGLTDQEVVRTVLEDCAPHRPQGQWLSASSHPTTFPGVRERWKFIEATLKKSPFTKVVPILGSVGCPYKCDFCMDSTVSYQPLDFEALKEDLRFVVTQLKHPFVAWHDPNFGVRFDEYMTLIEEVVPPNSIVFGAGMTLSLLSETHLKRLQKNGFKYIQAGIESWYTVGQKTHTSQRQGVEKVKQISEYVNLVLRYIPTVCANFIFGFDSDEGNAPFDLTKLFVDMTPGVFPIFHLLTAYGEAAPSNLVYQREARVLPLPFHFLDCYAAMNIKPKQYTWPAFYDRIIDMYTHTFSWQALFNRYNAAKQFSSPVIPRWFNAFRGMSFKFGKTGHHRHIRTLIDTDSEVRAFFEGDTSTLPTFYLNWLRHDLGPFWEWLPEGAIYHDQNAYLKKELLP